MFVATAVTGNRIFFNHNVRGTVSMGVARLRKLASAGGHLLRKIATAGGPIAKRFNHFVEFSGIFLLGVWIAGVCWVL